MDTGIGCEGRVVRIDEVIGRLGTAAGPDFRVAVRAQGVVLLRLGLALCDLVRFMQRRRVRTASANLSVPVAIRLQSDGIYLFFFLSLFSHSCFFFFFFSTTGMNFGRYVTKSKIYLRMTLSGDEIYDKSTRRNFVLCLFDVETFETLNLVEKWRRKCINFVVRHSKIYTQRAICFSCVVTPRVMFQLHGFYWPAKRSTGDQQSISLNDELWLILSLRYFRCE